MLFSKLFSGRTINSFERKLLDLAVRYLSPNFESLVRSQIAQINYVQRHTRDKEIMLYCLRKGKPYHEESLKLPFRQGEWKILDVSFHVGGHDLMFKSGLWLVDGFVSSLTFDGPTTAVQKREDIIIDKIEKYEDMFLSEKQPSVLREEDVQWLSEKVYPHKLSNIKPALSHEEHQGRLKMIDSRLPDDCIEIFSRMDSFEVGNCRFLGLAGLFHVVTETSNGYVLAECKGDNFILVKEGQNDAMVYIVKHDDEKWNPVGKSIIDAMKSVLLTS